jgi:hypothetical protein
VKQYILRIIILPHAEARLVIGRLLTRDFESDRRIRSMLFEAVGRNNAALNVRTMTFFRSFF